MAASLFDYANYGQGPYLSTTVIAMESMPTSQRASGRPSIFEGFEDVDVLEQPKFVAAVAGAKLKAGMVILDELGTPSVGLDQRVRTVRGSGDVAFLVHDFDERRIRQMQFGSRAMFTVIAGKR